jgi:hypothetical protein
LGDSLTFERAAGSRCLKMIQNQRTGQFQEFEKKKEKESKNASSGYFKTLKEPSIFMMKPPVR